MADRQRVAFVVAWGGTAAFGASLLWFLYCYLIRFEDPNMSRAASAVPTSGGSAAAAIAIDVLLFSIFAFHHSLLARPAAKTLVRRIAPPALERSLYTWVASILFALVCWLWAPVPGTFYRLDGIWRAIFYGIQLAGILLTIRASRLLDVLDLSGVRPVERAASSAPPKHVPLETTGLYGFVRHPLYFAWMLVVFATPDMTATRFVFALVSTLYLAIAIPWEERALIDTFGPDYERYRQRVRWRMLPGVY
jgi:protein-S-isoprenylcysteine O-methyltransferase Ste14